jgi:hypothetical protein
MKEFHLLVDDIRVMDVDYIAKDAFDGIRALHKYPVTHLYMDHDLGDISRNTGYHMLTIALEDGICPEKVTFVTSNPVGRDNMIRALENHGYTKKGQWYEKDR